MVSLGPGEFFSGSLRSGSLTIMQPETTPALPKPATARPTIRTVELCAVAETTDPTSNIAKAERKTYLWLSSEYSLPKGSWKEHMVSR